MSIQVVLSRPLELMFNCHALDLDDIVIGLILGCAMMLQLLRVPRVVRLSNGEEVLTAAYSESGMPYMGLTVLLHLPSIRHDAGDEYDEVHLSDSIHKDPLEMLHLRCGHLSKSKLLVVHGEWVIT